MPDSPEEGCTKFSGLQRHLDCGNHVRALESELMLDKVVRGYTARPEGQSQVGHSLERTLQLRIDTPAR